MRLNKSKCLISGSSWAMKEPHLSNIMEFDWTMTMCYAWVKVPGSYHSSLRERTVSLQWVCRWRHHSTDSYIPLRKTPEVKCHDVTGDKVFMKTRVFNTCTLPQSHSSPASRNSFPQSGPPYSPSEAGGFSRQPGFTLSRNTLICSRLQSLNRSGNSLLYRLSQKIHKFSQYVLVL